MYAVVIMEVLLFTTS